VEAVVEEAIEAEKAEEVLVEAAEEVVEVEVTEAAAAEAVVAEEEMVIIAAEAMIGDGMMTVETKEEMVEKGIQEEGMRVIEGQETQINLEASSLQMEDPIKTPIILSLIRREGGSASVPKNPNKGESRTSKLQSSSQDSGRSFQ
jgi:hypothetical protein